MTQLTHDELSSLIEAYESELRKLNFRVDLTKKTLEELYVLLRNKSDSKLPELQKMQPTPEIEPEPEPAPAAEAAPVEEEEVAIAEPAAPAAPAPAVEKSPKSAPKPRRKRSKIDASEPPQGIDTGKGYRLSEWDNVILHAVYNANYPLTYNEMFEEGMKYVHQSGADLIEPQVKGKINRALQKLCANRGIVLKFPHEGRGYTYGLNTWVDAEGNLQPEHDRPEAEA